jgi:hypothetical protein
MSSTEITIGGAPYVRSRDAARAAHLSPDYVSRLAKRGLIDGKLIDGHWFINERSLAGFLTVQEREKELWRVQLSELRREEQRRLGHPSAVLA